MRLLVTAGPTREYLDAVRFLSNPSSGRMGFAVARAAVEAGHGVTLITGPVSLPTPPGVERVDVVSALEMRAAVLARFEACDGVVMAAAVADFRPAETHDDKIKKTGQGHTLHLRLVRNPDILAELGRRKGDRLLVGFALETTLDRREARRKIQTKRLDAIVLNTTGAFAAERSTVEILTAGGRRLALADATKAQIAERLVALLPALGRVGQPEGG